MAQPSWRMQLRLLSIALLCATTTAFVSSTRTSRPCPYAIGAERLEDCHHLPLRPKNPTALCVRGGAKSGAKPKPGVRTPYPHQSHHTSTSNSLGPITHSEKKRRRIFIRKVYLTLCIQCFFTGGLTLKAMQHQAWVLGWLSGMNRLAVVLFPALGCLAAIIALTEGKKEWRQRNHVGISLVTLFTLCQSLMVALISVHFTSNSVWLAFLQTALATAGLTLYAFRTNPKHDMSTFGSMLESGLLTLLGTSLIQLIFPRAFGRMDLLISAGAALIFSGYIVYDTQLMLGGKHRKSHQLDRKDWAAASVTLYQDVTSLFIHLLDLFGTRERESRSGRKRQKEDKED